MNLRRKTFTLVEIVVTIVILGIVMIPLGLISFEYIQAIENSRNISKAGGLAKTEMAKINNLAYTDVTLADGYDNTTSNYEGYNYDLRRTVSYVSGWNNNLKKVQVRIYPLNSTTTQLINLITYVANVSFGGGSSGGGGCGDQVDSFALSGGSIKKKKLKKITYKNTGGCEIVLTTVKVTFTGRRRIKLKKIKQNKTTLWSGKANSGDTIALSTPLVMDATTSYNKNQFEFSKNVSTVTVDYYEFEDSTQTGSYSW